mmetsp:Transcript_49007/g.140870  ORF Transcript_49007/g.140870 Transcript_49007/m.140870 type:complete len:270 (+) Transcript_49007:87-896(+)
MVLARGPSFVKTPNSRRGRGPVQTESPIRAHWVGCPLVQRLLVVRKESGVVEQARRETERNNLGDTPTIVGNVDKDWLVNWLVRLPKNWLTTEWCHKLDCKGPNFLHELGSLLMQMPLQLPIPPNIREDQAALSTSFTAQAKQLGRISHGVMHADIKGYNYDQAVGGAFSIEWKEGMATFVQHLPAERCQIPPRISITKDFKILCWHGDSQRMLKKTQAEHSLKIFSRPGRARSSTRSSRAPSASCAMTTRKRPLQGRLRRPRRRRLCK